jgi:acetyl/propionyl-CoA carboxylase alpha subunit
MGYPVLVKASAGGGGKGMRVVTEDGDAIEAIGAARREAVAAFGDGTLYVERLLERPRHVEVQIFADSHGNVVHLFERECSVQRRHQKVIEESPSPAVSNELRRRMGDAAVAAARAAEYRNAGTIEFLVEGEGEHATFFFLEMNTRLQVEHPVTEAIAGVDLVRAQFIVAEGGRLPWTQATLSQRGHALECRIYAEDPASGFLPQAGPLRLYREPSGPGVRVDSGVREGDHIGVNYDPLLAKLIVHAESREAARLRALSALGDYPVLGTRTNIPFLIRLLELPAFRDGQLHTGMIDEHLAELTRQDEIPVEALVAAAFATAPAARPDSDQAATDRDPWSTLHRWGR